MNMDSILQLGIILLGCSIGFSRSALFITIGYGMAIAVCGIELLVLIGLYQQTHSFTYMSIMILIHGLVYLLYGSRLAGFIYYREKNTEFKKDPSHRMEIEITFTGVIILWIGVSFLYYCYTLPPLISLRALKENGYLSPIIHTIGLIIMGIGFTFETVSDYQKWVSKAYNPDLFCSTGLFKLCRMPNYFGELLFWIGNYVTCFWDSKSGLQIILSSLGALFSCWLMISASARLDNAQFKHYHKNPEYINYRDSVPILIPSIPIFSLRMSNKTDYNCLFYYVFPLNPFIKSNICFLNALASFCSH